MNLEQIDKQRVWHPYTQMKDWMRSNNKVIVHGDGFYLVDSKGRRYLDGCASMWCNVWGHSQKEIINPVINQVKQIQHSTLFGLGNQPATELAEMLIKISRKMDYVFYSDNGSTAIEIALKMALQYWRNKGNTKKKRFLSLKNGYHGDTAGAMSVGYVPNYFRSFKPMLRLSTRISPPASCDIINSSASPNQDYFNNVEKVFSAISSECCALVMESGAQIAGGVNIYPPGFQKTIAELCQKYDMLLILDEVATGFGRLGNMVEYLAQESIPDIVCFGKALTGGFSPLAATLCNNDIFSSFLSEYSEGKQFYHGHTYTGHPVGCTAAIANIRLYSKHKLISRIRINSNYLRKRLKDLVESPIIGSIGHKGLLAAIQLVSKYGKKRAIENLNVHGNQIRMNYYLTQEALKMGVFIRGIGSTIVVIPPLAIGRNELKLLLDVICELIGRIEHLS
ncbi:MAG: adenosylmethionine--8-amino-7-oxononanoate transaminase [Thermoproteota archaeon]|nr:adenosylmethionine--8-amino-7-oxononanoate transaminase [Thermoproteota archaeon]